MSNARKVYFVLTQPEGNLLTCATVRQLASVASENDERAKFYVVKTCDAHSEVAQSSRERLRSQTSGIGADISFLFFDFMDATAEESKRAAENVVRAILKEEGVQTATDGGKARLNGVLLNLHGFGGGEAGDLDVGKTGLLQFAKWKLFGSFSMLDALLDSFEVGRVVVAGTESARGLPDMGFPCPQFEDSSRESLVDRLTDASLYGEPFDWKPAYAVLTAMDALIVGRLAKKYPKIHFSTISPGFTQDSLHADHVPNATVGLRVQFFVLRWCYFLLKGAGIAHEAEDGARYFVRALAIPDEWDAEFYSGAFVAAKEGTSGPICDQSQLPGGAMFKDDDLRALVYDTVQTFLP